MDSADSGADGVGGDELVPQPADRSDDIARDSLAARASAEENSAEDKQVTQHHTINLSLPFCYSFFSEMVKIFVQLY